MLIVSSSILLSLYLNLNSLLALSKNECYDSWQCESSSLEGLTLCLGYCSCQASTISTEYYLTCNGYRSCIDSDISATDTIACNENYSCQNAKLSTSDILRCNGDYACFNADIDAAKVISNGMYSLYAARIDTKTMINDEISIYVNGYLSGYNSDVICRSGSKCNLICQGNACNQLQFACLHGSECNVSPPVCTADNKPNTIDDFADGRVSCPLWTKSESKHEDKVLINRLDQRRVSSLEDETKIPRLSDLESPSVAIFGENDVNKDEGMFFHHRQVRSRNDDKGDDMKYLSSDSLITSLPKSVGQVHVMVIGVIIICAMIMISSCLWYCHTKYVNLEYKSLDSI